MKLCLKASFSTFRVPLGEPLDGGVKFRSRDLCVPTYQCLQHCIMDKDVLVLGERRKGRREGRRGKGREGGWEKGKEGRGREGSREGEGREG